MSNINRDDRLEHVAQRVENVIADRDNHGLLLHSSGRPFINSSVPGRLSSDFGNCDKPQKVPEVVKDIIMHDFGDTDDDEDSLKDLRTPKGSLSARKSIQLLPDDIAFESVNQLKAENKNLKANLYKIEDDLIRIKAERDNMAIKFNTLNEKDDSEDLSKFE